MATYNYGDGSQYQHNNPQLVDINTVDNYTLADYGLTVDAVKLNHFGIDVTDPRTGEYLPDAFYESKIEAAVAQAEKMLDIVILPRVIQSEHHDYYRNDFSSFMFIKAYRKPILQLENVQLEYGGSMVFSYPSKWWRLNHLGGSLEMLPSYMLAGEQGALNLATAYSGYPMIAGVPYLVGNEFAPQMFHMDYVAGMLPPARRGVTQVWEMHPDLWNMIIKMALREVFEQWGRLIIGAGIANMTISIDGVSQSIDSTQSAMYGGASADIIQLDKDIQALYDGLRSYYGNNLGII